MLDRKTLTLSLAVAGILLAPMANSSAQDKPKLGPVSPSGTAADSSTPTATSTSTTPSSTSTTPSATSTTPTATSTTPTPTIAVPGPARAHAARRSHSRKHPRHVTAHLASDPSDTMSDFKFTPASITVHVGDTVTWTNDGPTQHSATASNGSFDTGLLSKGGTASHTFSTPGTIAYICKIHPFMHGTVIVLAAAGTSTAATPTGSSSPAAGSTATPSSSGTTSSTGSTSAASPTSSGSTLPVTGLDLAATVIFGLLMLGAGLTIRRRMSA